MNQNNNITKEKQQIMINTFCQKMNCCDDEVSKIINIVQPWYIKFFQNNFENIPQLIKEKSASIENIYIEKFYYFFARHKNLDIFGFIDKYKYYKPLSVDQLQSCEQILPRTIVKRKIARDLDNCVICCATETNTKHCPLQTKNINASDLIEEKTIFINYDVEQKHVHQTTNSSNISKFIPGTLIDVDDNDDND